TIRDLPDFNSAVGAMNRLGDPRTSPISKLITRIHEETSWDNPLLGDADMQEAQKGFTGWFARTILRRSPAPVTVNVDASGEGFGRQPAFGTVGREFSGLANLVAAKDKDASLMGGYMAALS